MLPPMESLAASPAADVNKCLAMAQLIFAADMIHLVALCFF